MLETIGLFPLQISSPSCLNITSCHAFPLSTTDNQFGFKPKHGTDMCIFLLKKLCRIIYAKIPHCFHLSYMHLKHLTELITTCCLLN